MSHRTEPARWAVIATIALACSACWANDGFLIDSVCMPASMALDTPHEIRLFDLCRACEERRDFQCHVDVMGSEIEVWGTLESKERGSCSPDFCDWAEERCTLPALAEGSYVLHFDGHDGAWTTTVDVGSSTADTSCHRDGSAACPVGCD